MSAWKIDLAPIIEKTKERIAMGNVPNILGMPVTITDKVPPDVLFGMITRRDDRFHVVWIKRGREQ